MNIIVNAYPLRFSGALQILKQFIAGVKNYSIQTDKYYIYVDSSLDLEESSNNIEFIPVQQNFIKKTIFYFNWRGLKKDLKKRGIKADKIISLANVNTSLGEGVEEYVYFHQPLTIYRYKWSIFSSPERVLLMYKHYYKWIIKRSITKRTIVVVQLECIKRRFSDIFSVAQSRILKISPNVIIPKTKNQQFSIEVDDNVINLIYPATPIKYKNHQILIDALGNIPEDIGVKVKLYLTCKPEELKFKQFTNTNVEIVFLGHISFDELMLLYTKMDALLFPSYIESFGLPMIEAATTGIRIIAADTDFANEVLKSYTGVTYIPPFNANEWTRCILNIKKNERFTPLEIKQEDSWKILFDKINQ